MVLPTNKENMMNPDELLSNLLSIVSTLNNATIELHNDPALVADDGWRERLEQTGYEISTLLSTENN